MRNFLIRIVSVVLLTTSASAQDGAFSEDILPLLQSDFAPLLVHETSLELDSWESLIRGSDFGQVLIPFDAEGSLLIRLATSLPDNHPLRPAADSIPPDAVDKVRAWIADGARSDAGSIPFADATDLLYVCNEGAASIHVIDMDAHVIARTIRLEELGFTRNAKPHHVAVEPDGSLWYVSLIGDDVVLKFNRANELVGQVAFERPGMLALHPGSDDLLVGRSMKAVNPPQRIGRLKRSTMTIDEIDVFFARPHAINFHPTGSHAYIGSLAENRMATLQLANEHVDLSTIEGPTHTLVQYALSPDGETMAVGGQLTGKILFFDTTRPEEPTITDTLAVGAAPWHPVFTPNGRELWFGNKMAGTVTVVDMEDRSIAAVIPGMAQPHGSAVSRDGKYVYVSNNNLNGSYIPRYDFGDLPGVVAVINTSERQVERMLEVGANATGLGTAGR